MSDVVMWLTPLVGESAYRRNGSREVIQRIAGFHTGLQAWLVEIMNERGHRADTRGRVRTMYVRKRGIWFQVIKPTPDVELSRRQRMRLSKRNRRPVT